MSSSNISYITCANNSFPLIQSRKEVLDTITKVASIISIASCSLVILFIFILRRYKILSQRLVLYKNSAVLLKCLLLAINDKVIDNTTVCFSIALIMTYADWVQILCLACLVFNLFFNVVHWKKTESIEWVFISISFVLPLPLACVPLINYSYGPSGLWCWITNSKLQIFAWYIPVAVGMVITYVFYFYTVWYIGKIGSSWNGLLNNNLEAVDFKKHFIKPLQFYPLIFLLVDLISCLARLVCDLLGSYLFGFYVTMSLLEPSTGTLMSIAYIWDSRAAIQSLKEMRSRKKEDLSIRKSSITT